MAFSLSEDFIDSFRGRQPSWGPLGYIVYKRTYSRIKEDGSNEEFWETIRRVVEGAYRIQALHCKQNKLPWSPSRAQKSAQEMYQRMWDMKFLAPGRGLWAMGAPVVDKIGSACLMNCAFVSTSFIDKDFSDPFAWMMDKLMLGAGVGFDVLGAGKVIIQTPQPEAPHFVEDSREGWVELIRRILGSYTGQDTWPVYIDYSGIREAGAPLKTFGGVCSGYKPLEILVNDIAQILDPLIGKSITASAIVDVMNVIGKCVVAGNIRRSSEIALSPPSEEFLNLKNPDINLDKLTSHRWASNNSLFVSVGDDYKRFAELTAKNGEPGYVWMENTRKYGRMGDVSHPDSRAAGWNPCSEQCLEHKEMCNLVETFPARCDSLDDFLRTLKFAYLYAKTVTLIPTHDPETNAVMMRNRRIGTSQSGIIQNFEKIGRREHFHWCDVGYKYIRDLDTVYSEWLCVPRSIKVTTVKPSGTVSQLAGATPGIHYPHSKFYYRTVRFQKNSELLDSLREARYRIEQDVYSPDTVVVYFPIKEEYFDRSKSDVSMWEQLENVAQMQHYWSDNGVSATITFSPQEASSIEHALQLYESRLKTISFLPMEDHGYVQAPYQEISEQEYIQYSSQIGELDWTSKNTKEQTDAYCDGGVCMLRAS